MRQTSWRKWLLRRLWSHDLDITSGVREGLVQALEEGKGEQLSYRQPTEMSEHRAHAGGCDPLSLQRWPESRRMSCPIFLALIQ